MTYSPSIIPGAVEPYRFNDHAEKVNALRRAVDEARIRELGVASILECTSEKTVARRAARLLETHQCDAVSGALEAWWDLYRSSGSKR